MIRNNVYCLSVGPIYSFGIYLILATDSSFKNEIKFTTQNMNMKVILPESPLISKINNVL